MEREHDSADLIELGTASVETQGPVGVLFDEQIASLQQGLSDD